MTSQAHAQLSTLLLTESIHNKNSNYQFGSIEFKSIPLIVFLQQCQGNHPLWHNLAWMLANVRRQQDVNCKWYSILQIIDILFIFINIMLVSNSISFLFRYQISAKCTYMCNLFVLSLGERKKIKFIVYWQHHIELAVLLSSYQFIDVIN